MPPVTAPRTPEGALSLYADSDPTLDKPPLVLPPLEVDDSDPRATLQCLIMRTGVYAQMHPNDVEDHLYDDVITFCDVVRSHARWVAERDFGSGHVWVGSENCQK